MERELTNTSDTPMLVDFYAIWCGPCAVTTRQLDLAAAQFGDKIRVAKVDIDRDPKWASRFKVKGLPTTLLIHNGKIRERMEGAITKEALLKFVDPYINPMCTT